MTTAAITKPGAAHDLQIDFSSVESFVHNSILMDACASILAVAHLRKLDCIVLKGAAMIIDGYPHAAGRTMNDIDILIRENEKDSWQLLLVENGYKPLQSGTTIFIYEDIVPIIFDIHTSLRFIPPNLTDTLWSTARKVSYQESVYLLLPYEIDLVYQCLHYTITHGYGDVKWLRDMDALIRTFRNFIDWYDLFEYARECHAIIPLAALLFRLKKTLGTPVPVAVIDDCTQYISTPLGRLFSHIVRNNADGIPFFDYVAPFFLQESLRAFLQVLVRKVFPPIAEMRIRYGTASFPGTVVRYPLRWIRMFCKGTYAFVHCMIRLMR